MPRSDRTIEASVKLAAVATRLAVEVSKLQQATPPPSRDQTNRRETLDVIRSTRGGNETSGFQ
jgi:hypothetical protein